MKDLLQEEKYHADSLMGIETEDLGEENLEHNPYSPNDIRINQRIFTIYQIQHMIETKKLFLTPDFQRNLVWDPRRKSLLIDSIMLGIPISSFYFQEDYEGNKIVIDGLQRLSTISQFMDNEFALRELQYLNYNRCRYCDLPQKYVNKVDLTKKYVWKTGIPASFSIRIFKFQAYFTTRIFKTPSTCSSSFTTSSVTAESTSSRA